MTVQSTYPTEYDLDLEVSAFTKHNWKTAEARDRWKPSLDACKRALPLVEMIAVTKDDTPRRVAQIERARLRDDRYVNIISEYGLRVVTDHDHAIVCADVADGEDAKEAHAEQDWRAYGELLGIPPCCIDEHLKRDGVGAPIYEMACRSDNAVALDDDNQEILLEDPDPMVNILWQAPLKYGYAFFTHVPCSFDCEQSSEIAKAHGGIFRELDLGDEAEDLWEFLSTPTTWSGLNGMSNIRNGYLIGSTNTPSYWDEKIVIWGEEHASKLL